MSLLQNANTNKNLRNGAQVLDAEEFVTFYMSLMTRSEVKELFARYTKLAVLLDTSCWAKYETKSKPFIPELVEFPILVIAGIALLFVCVVFIVCNVSFIVCVALCAICFV
jgi:hypothetical protein